MKRNFLLPAFLCGQIFIERETSGHEAVVVAGTSYQMKEVFINSIVLSGEGFTFVSNCTNIFAEKSKTKLSRVSFFWNTQNLQVKSRTRARSRPQILSSLTLIQHGTCFKITPACWDLPQRQHQVKPTKSLNCCDKGKHYDWTETNALKKKLWKSEEDQGRIQEFLMGCGWCQSVIKLYVNLF